MPPCLDSKWQIQRCKGKKLLKRGPLLCWMTIFSGGTKRQLNHHWHPQSGPSSAVQGFWKPASQKRLLFFPYQLQTRLFILSIWPASLQPYHSYRSSRRLCQFDPWKWKSCSWREGVRKLCYHQRDFKRIRQNADPGNLIPKGPDGYFHDHLFTDDIPQYAEPMHPLLWGLPRHLWPDNRD